jgi:enoyl-CoA hydratase
MTEPATLIVERDGPVVVLTMNRPERRNALNPDMLIRMADSWDMIDADDDIRCAILTGSGEAYCAGGDMADGWMGRRDREPKTEIEKRQRENPGLVGKGLLLTYWLRKPLIAAVNGDCMGGGCEMLQQTDIRVAEEQARFGVPEARRGLIAGAGSTMRLKRQIPYTIAMEMLMLGRILSAQEALRWGLVGHVVPKGDALNRAKEIASELRANGPISVAASKASAVETGWLPEEDARPIEGRYAGKVMSSEDAREGMKAFTEKRPPNFRGK